MDLQVLDCVLYISINLMLNVFDWLTFVSPVENSQAWDSVFVFKTYQKYRFEAGADRGYNKRQKQPYPPQSKIEWPGPA